MARVLAGGLGAVIATVFAHYFNVVVGDAAAALIGFAVGYAIVYRIAAGRLGTLSMAGGALALFLGDRGLYQLGMHGLPRKLGAIAIAVAVIAGAVQLTSTR